MKEEENVEKVEEVVEETKNNNSEPVKLKIDKKTMIIVGVVIAVIVLILAIVLGSNSPKKAAGDMLNLMKRDPIKAMEKYTPNKNFEEKKTKILGSRSEHEITEVEKINTNKYKIKAKVKNVNGYKVLRSLNEKLEENDKYKKDTDDENQKRKNEKIYLDTLKECVKKADTETDEIEFKIWKENGKNWVSDYMGIGMGL